MNFSRQLDNQPDRTLFKVNRFVLVIELILGELYNSRDEGPDGSMKGLAGAGEAVHNLKRFIITALFYRLL